MESERARRKKIRRARVRAKVKGTPRRPRLCVSITNRHIYAQLVDDGEGKTLCAMSTLDAELRVALKGKPMREKAAALGGRFAEAALAKGFGAVVFDRNGRLYGLRMKNLADAARAAGLKF
ncbi:MAG: 50S ribosomal protein L18 [bacterium]